MTHARAILTGLVVFALGITLVGCGRSVPRIISVDSVQLTPGQIHKLDQRYCGYFPDGNYIVDSRTGQWSIEISPDPSKKDIYSQAASKAGPKMVKSIAPLEDHCKIVEAQRPRDILSERGLVFPSTLSD
jgi:hypothetical protein